MNHDLQLKMHDLQSSCDLLSKENHQAKEAHHLLTQETGEQRKHLAQTDKNFTDLQIKWQETQQKLSASQSENRFLTNQLDSQKNVVSDRQQWFEEIKKDMERNFQQKAVEREER